jgi:hypothetical protein
MPVLEAGSSAHKTPFLIMPGIRKMAYFKTG